MAARPVSDRCIFCRISNTLPGLSATGPEYRSGRRAAALTEPIPRHGRSRRPAPRKPKAASEKIGRGLAPGGPRRDDGRRYGGCGEGWVCGWGAGLVYEAGDVRVVLEALGDVAAHARLGLQHLRDRGGAGGARGRRREMRRLKGRPWTKAALAGADDVTSAPRKVAHRRLGRGPCLSG